MFKVPGEVERTGGLSNLSLSTLLNRSVLVCRDNSVSIEVLQFIVLGHVGGKDFRECLNLRGQLKFFDEPVSVLFKLLGLDLLVSIQLVNSLVELSDFLTALLILASFVVAKVFEKDLSGELSERSGKHVRFELKELVDRVFVFNSIEDVCGKIDDILKRLIQKMTLQAKL